MLAHSSDMLSQIVCPMDEDPIPPLPFCSPPPHSVPSPPLLLPSSITPSCAEHGKPEHRRSGRIQAIKAKSPQKPNHTNSRADEIPSTQNPSPPKRQRLIESMVQESKQPQVSASLLHEEQKKDGFSPTVTAQDPKRQKKEERQPDVSATGNMTEQVVDRTTQDLHITKSNRESCEDSAFDQTGENISSSSAKGWLIGPLIQTFKSKISSFSEIVWSPAKLFKPTTDPDSADLPGKLAECKQEGEASHVESESVQKSETPPQESGVNEQMLGEDAQTAKHGGQKYSKRLVFDAHVPENETERRDESAIRPIKTDTVPLPDSSSHSSPLDESPELQPSINLSSMEDSDDRCEYKRQHKLMVLLKPPRKLAGNRSVKVITSQSVTPQVENGNSDPVFNEGNISQWSSVQVDKDNSMNRDSVKSPPSSVVNTHLCTENSYDEGKKNVDSVERSELVKQSLRRNVHDIVPSTVTSSTDEQLIPDSGSAAGLGRSKRGQKGSGHSQDLIRPKKVKADICSGTMDKKAVVIQASECGKVRTQREALVTKSTRVDGEDNMKPIRKIAAVTLRANKKGKVGQDTIPKMESSDVFTFSSLNESCSSSEKSQKNSKSDTKPSAPGKRTKARSRLDKLDVNVENMDLETTVAITSPKDAQEEPLLEILVQNEVEINKTKSKKPIKRKSPTQTSSATEVETTFSSPVSSTELTPTDLSSIPVITEHLRTTNQTTKKPKSTYKGGVKCSGSEEAQKVQPCHVNLVLKKVGTKKSKSKDTVNPLYFEMTPSESGQQLPSSSSTSQLKTEQLNNRGTDIAFQNKMKVSETAIPDSGASNPSNISVSRTRSRPRAVITNPRPKRSEKGRRKASEMPKDEDKTQFVAADRADLSTRSLGRKKLLRSYSCPEISFPQPHDAPWSITTPAKSPHYSQSHASHLNLVFKTPPVPHTHKFVRRTRRHTVCSLEVEREIAPLCLRKEVYPRRRSAPIERVNWQTSSNAPRSPGGSLSALANYFLSSPLAFLSKRAPSRGAATVSYNSSNQVSSPSPLSPSFALSSAARHHPEILQRCDSPHLSNSNTSEQVFEHEAEKVQGMEAEEECEDTSSSSHEYEDVAFREEKALSDSELKVETAQKQEERGKVSSIRIRRALPKPQNNLTPMGLPKAVRLKKKEFSLEEIYTNKNFSKPPESRLETIFEVPLYRRNGSESLFGQRRVKRFLEFLDVGEVRKPKKPLVGVGKVVTTSSRTRRGGNAKEEPVMTVQDVDSLLCAKLDQLNLWLTDDQKGR